ncbi:MAG: uroporphyrinogen decarboxylase [Planctomycetes bacterium]|nr:uroporphyrinogen decarboxylase [Planctomycetota bacterium]
MSEKNESGERPATSRARFLDAAWGRCRGRPPVWLLRQAGRYMPRYQELRGRHSFEEMCTRPDLAFEVSLQPWREFGMDAVIVFYDILFILKAMGAPLEYTDRGPVFHRPVREPADVRALRLPEPGAGSQPVAETLRMLRRELGDRTALLGFAGAPFTLASYLVEGEFRRSGDRIRRMMHSDPETLEELLEMLADATIDHLERQVAAGADAVQLFDTWAGLLGAEDYARFALRGQTRIFEALRPLGVPTILYVNGSSHLLELMARSGARVLSVDWRVSLPEARRRVGPGVALQGNLDPAALFSPPRAVREMTRALLESVAGDPAYICNLGHGILPETPVESVRAFVETAMGFPER